MEIYTDGSCKVHTTQEGIWAFVVVVDDDIVYSKHGTKQNTTNNQMEMEALKQALDYSRDFPERDITIYSDSQYCVKGYNIWSESWVKKDFQGIANSDLWREINSIPTLVEVEWIRGHDGNKWNEYVDQMTRQY